MKNLNAPINNSSKLDINISEQDQKNPDSSYNQERRKWLVNALKAGVFGASGVALSNPALAQWFGSRPRRIQPGRSFSSISGDVRVNGEPATIETPVKPGDVVETGARSKASFVVETDSFQLRANTRMRILAPKKSSAAGELVDEGIELLKGAALFVFGRRKTSRMRISTSFATIGLRGTGLYLEAEEDKTYFCLCYGETDLSATAAPEDVQNIKSEHHDAPVYIYGEGTKDLITPAPFKNHTDLELAVLEELVGRQVPFALDDYYDTPRRDDY